ncbi:hypothetical protein PQR34_32125 [Paraburkholderia sediminicola]|uniref:hypothetical protein n=1 Tax=Paraburkholderia sediminicola TaxID=458836 RepID=UPI0038B72D8E
MSLTHVSLIAAVIALSGVCAPSFADLAIDPTLVANSAREARMVAAELNGFGRAASGSAAADRTLTRPAAGPAPADHNEDKTRARQTANPL